MMVVAAVLAIAEPAYSQAPQCPAGQVFNEDTQGHCCWPQQVWSAKRAVCVGIPACPPGSVVEGETCRSTAPVTPAPAAPPPAAVAPPPPAPPPPAVKKSPTAAPAVQVPRAATAPAPPPTRAVYVTRPGQIITGAFLLALGIAVIGGSVPMWRDALDTDQSSVNRHMSGRDAAMLAGALALDVSGVICVTVGAVQLSSGIKGRRVDVPVAFEPEPVHGSVAGLEVGLAF
jgi:hypothetical protein